jgi:hypothetical protein
MSDRCQAQTKNGNPCRAYAQSNSTLCFTHDPAIAAERRRARLIGGYNHRARKIRPFPLLNVSTPASLKAFLEVLIRDTWQLGNSVNRTRALCQLTKLQKDIITDSRLKPE